MYDISGSIVVFKNDRNILDNAISSFLNTNLNAYLYIIDNSPTDALRDICSRENVEYVFNNNNIGFGAGHNIAIRKMMGNTKYSLMLNPDVYFEKGTIEKLFNFMERDESIGSIMPKVLYPNGSTQYLCRLLPTPWDLFLRKVNIKVLDPIINPRKFRYELRFADYTRTMDVPYLSGCFMFVRTNVFDKVGLFDERFFIYFEDVDLARRVHRFYRTVYYPEAFIYHGYERGSDKDISLFKYLILSAIRYFNKWGWFFDEEGKSINNKAVESIYNIPRLKA